ncbi:hypothetical protein SAMN05444000_11863 [Shimia gijangensis]|uniref:Lipoprotein n=1 Tax=Shimia gijangensis TaxID=1470563 RepID=A0A1M6PJB8_9RHOB|nr:hypothetical protein [Shimia gijangensis]SHK08036.1 hypothetical protein SAMN05444000_11863 [Shimia gijangensis]
MTGNKMNNLALKTGLAAAFLFGLSGLASACTGVEDNAPEISETYVDETGQFHAVGADGWLTFGLGEQLVYFVCLVDNENDYLIAQNGSANDEDYELYSRFEWFVVEDQLFFCNQVSDAGSQADAMDFAALPRADQANPTLRGCGVDSQAWSALRVVKP